MNFFKKIKRDLTWIHHVVGFNILLNISTFLISIFSLMPSEISKKKKATSKSSRTGNCKWKNNPFYWNTNYQFSLKNW